MYPSDNLPEWDIGSSDEYEYDSEWNRVQTNPSGHKGRKVQTEPISDLMDIVEPFCALIALLYIIGVIVTLLIKYW